MLPVEATLCKGVVLMLTVKEELSKPGLLLKSAYILSI